jgi:hypothetical protein
MNRRNSQQQDGGSDKNMQEDSSHKAGQWQQCHISHAACVAALSSLATSNVHGGFILKASRPSSTLPSSVMTPDAMKETP